MNLHSKAAILIALGVTTTIFFGNRTAAQAPAGAPPAQGGRAPAYPTHAQADPDTITRGQLLFSVNCSFCHGSDARGGDGGGPNLVRSQLVMNDNTGELIAPVVQNGRPELGMPKFELTAAQITDIAGYIHKVAANYRAIVGPPPNILVGNAAAGETYFNGAGKCNTCHSVTGDLAGIGAKLDPKTLQNAIVSGGGGGGRGGRGGDPASVLAVPPTTVTVTFANGKSYEGKLDHLDDFVVSLTDATGTHLSFTRNGDIPKVEIKNPLQAHKDLLTKYTDADIHNLTAYLVTLK